MHTRPLTEYEWRIRNVRRRSKMSWCGPQCVYSHARLKRLGRDKTFRIFMLLVSAVLAAAIPLLWRTPVIISPLDQTFSPDTQVVQPRRVNAITYALPDDTVFQRQLFSKKDLLNGKMLLLDAAHPLPADLNSPNTFSIARQGSGMVSVRSLTVKTGSETITALQKLFDSLRQKGISSIYVHQGATTESQQRQSRTEQTRMLMKQHKASEALQIALRQTEEPGTGDLLQEYAVELRLWNAETREPDERLLSETEAGQQLLQLAWRHGFVRTDQDHPYRFRYVGKAHATAMTYLDLDFCSYLEWMHRQGQLVVSEGGRPAYLILCREMDASGTMFDLPVGCAYEVSMDNTGYALAACTL